MFCFGGLKFETKYLKHYVGCLKFEVSCVLFEAWCWKFDVGYSGLGV